MAFSFLRECWAELNPANKGKANWFLERHEVLEMLRQVCEEHGDNDWPDDLHLADVIEKHLWRHLEDPSDDGELIE